MGNPMPDVMLGCVSVDEGVGPGMAKRRRALYAVTTVVLTLVMLGAVVDATGIGDVYGVRSGSVRSSGEGFELEVRYATTSRPGLATPFEIMVTNPAGLDQPVTLAIESEYLSMWDENGLDPQPASETMTDQHLLWTFEPPPTGDTLVASFDGRIEPAAQGGECGTVAVLDEQAQVVTSVSFCTTVRM